MTGTMKEIEGVARRHGLSLDELRALLTETDALRGLVGPADVEASLAEVLKVYIGALSASAERIIDPTERLVVDRFMSQAMETLAGQLEGASQRRN